MSERRLASGSVAFEAEGRLLQELGERLVAHPDIALVELIKNSYDADSANCSVRVADDGAALVITDSGAGMTQAQFLSRWMKIATAHKLDEPVSPRFGRKRTGQKGIGRFAVRFLGNELVLETVAEDEVLKQRTRLSAKFNWKKLDDARSLGSIKVDYTVTAAASSVPTGTTLRVEGLKHELDFLGSKDFRTRVLRIVSPLDSLDRGRFRRRDSTKYEVDPGFRVSLPSGEADEEIDIGKQVLARSWARLRIDFHNNSVTYTVDRPGGKKPKTLVVRAKSRIKAGVVADIRFFPRRKGIFSGVDFNGTAAWSWVRENCGVAVVDHGFRIRPYGFENDDWLRLDLDAAHNERDWRTEIAKREFPISTAVKGRPADNPALNMPSNFQLVGAVFVESQASGKGDDLTTAMDREGFLQNEAFDQLCEIVRGGIEFLALVDKKQLADEQEAKAAAAAASVREDFKAAIQNIRSSKTLSPGDKSRLVEHYSGLSKKVEEVEEYGREARRKLETMGLLGVVAGFMTHEAARILDGLEQALERLRDMADLDPALGEAIRSVEEGYEAFKEHVDYTSVFIESMHREHSAPFKAQAQVRRILEKFGTFAQDRAIECRNEVSAKAEVSGIPVAAYSGVVLNLYTNALKAVLAREGGADAPQIVVRGWNEPGHHVIEVLDKGNGIPVELRQRIFDPLFTTTSNTNNPLGSGMGLGLSLVKEVVTNFGGKIRLVDAPAGFSTCFHVEFKGGDE